MTLDLPAQQQLFLNSLPLHGGDLRAASARFGVPINDWVDLSTGVNAEPYPVPNIPAKYFCELPYDCNDFNAAAKNYYGAEPLLAVAGSQVAIQLLPRILNRQVALPVLLPEVGYQEHHKQWRAQGAAITQYCSTDYRRQCEEITLQLTNNPLQHLLVIRPNNPTGILGAREQLLEWSSMLGESAYLIVDEAFIDTVPEQSLLCLPELPGNVVVLRSFGKFFGLAGIRLGFVFAKSWLLQQLAAQVGIWQVNGPAKYIATQALLDTPWQTRAIDRALNNALKTEKVFNRLFQFFGVTSPQRNALFLSYSMSLDEAVGLYSGLANLGVLTRLVVLPGGQALLRVGCISLQDANTLAKVSAAIDKLCCNC